MPRVAVPWGRPWDRVPSARGHVLRPPPTGTRVLRVCPHPACAIRPRADRPVLVTGQSDSGRTRRYRTDYRRPVRWTNFPGTLRVNGCDRIGTGGWREGERLGLLPPATPRAAGSGPMAATLIPGTAHSMIWSRWRAAGPCPLTGTGPGAPS